MKLIIGRLKVSTRGGQSPAIARERASTIVGLLAALTISLAWDGTVATARFIVALDSALENTCR